MHGLTKPKCSADFVVRRRRSLKITTFPSGAYGFVAACTPTGAGKGQIDLQAMPRWHRKLAVEELALLLFELGVGQRAAIVQSAKLCQFVDEVAALIGGYRL
jgi:hypothetical protein